MATSIEKGSQMLIDSMKQNLQIKLINRGKTL